MKAIMIYAGKCLLATALMMVTCLLFILFVGERAEGNDMSVLMFLLIKVFSLVGLLACGYAWFWCSESGLLPRLPEDFYHE